MKPFMRGGRDTDLYRITAAVAAAVLLVAVFVLTQPVDLRRHNTLLGYFSQLQRDDAQLGEAVLQLHFNLMNNYDQVTAISKNMRDIARELRSGEVADGPREDAEFRQQLQLLEQQLSEDQEALEKFKSNNSVLKNSLNYLPHARDELEKDLPPGTAAHEDIDSLVEEILFKRFNASRYEHDHVEASIAVLGMVKTKLAVSTRKKFDNLLRHIRRVDRIERDMSILIRQLTTNGENERLDEAYRHYYDRQQERAAAYRLFLLLATLYPARLCGLCFSALAGEVP